MYISFVLVAGSLWGIISIFLNGLSLIGFTAFQCVALRVFFATLFLFIIIAVKDKNLLKIRIKDLPLISGMGLGCLGSSLFYVFAISLYGSSAIPALLLDTSPIFVLILSAIFLKERITPIKIISLLLTFFGVMLVTGVLDSSDGLSVKVIIVGLLSGVSYAVYSVVNKKAIERYDSLTLTFYAFLIATVLFLPFSEIFTDIKLVFKGKSVLNIVGLSLISTVVPFFLYSTGLRGLPASKVSILANSELVVASLVGIFYFGEEFSPSKIIGFILVFTAIVLLNVKIEKQKNHSKNLPS